MGDQVKKFLYQVSNAFEFLEKKYSYRKINKEYSADLDFRDAVVSQKYLGKKVGIEIRWAFSSAVIAVIFVELIDDDFPDQMIFWGNFPNSAKAIDLNTLVKMKNKNLINEFMLGDFDDTSLSQIKKREKTINQDLKKVLKNLSDLSIKYAEDIIAGNTKLFPEVMKFKKELLDQLY